MSGDDQKKLDVFSNDVMINCLSFSRQASVLGTEESDTPIICDVDDGYSIVFDPLDGSGNIDCNLSVGTIFGIYKKRNDKKKPDANDILRPGHELLASGYALYDSATMIFLTTGAGVNGFTLDPSIGEFILTHKDVKIPSRGKFYSINEGNSNNWDEPTKKYIESCKKKGMGARYVGSMVGDVHRTLLYGGIFCYPADKKSPSGKLRLLYECNPMGYLIEQAGGKATTGTQRILDLQPTKLHQRCPIFIGSKDDVSDVEKCYQQAGAVKAPVTQAKL